MSRTFETKAMMLESLRAGRKTVTQLSKELGLSKATVSQHIAELRRMGEVIEDDNSHFRRIKYFRLSSGSTREGKGIMPHWQTYAVIVAIVAAAIGGGTLAYYGSYNTPHMSVLPGGPQGAAPGAFACPVLLFYRTANYSDISTIVNGIAEGSPCYLTYVNLSSSMFDIGTGIAYHSANGTVSVPAVSYSYTLTAGQIARLENESVSGECWATNALQFFGISSQRPHSCVASIYS